ncbi:hypothetical protein HK096_004055, partial [Nowakowskiella sp. JEL0078]
MSLYALLKNGEGHVGYEEIEESFDGNLCRCTGYRPILEGARSLVGKIACSGDCETGEGCTKECESHDIEDIGMNWKKNLPELSTTEFPPELLNQLISNPAPLSYQFEHENIKWFHPATLKEFLQIL